MNNPFLATVCLNNFLTRGEVICLDNNTEKYRVLLLGPNVNAVSGVSTHLNQILNSKLSKDFIIKHFQIGSQGRDESLFGRSLRVLISPIQLYIQLLFFRPQILHLNTSLEWKSFWRDYLYLLVAIISPAKTVYQVHGGNLSAFVERHKIINIFIKRAFRLPKAIVAISTIEGAKYSQLAKTNKLFFVPNAIDLNDFCEKNCRNNNSEFIKLMYIGRLAEDKGVYDIIDAISILSKKKINYKFKLSIAGSGPEENKLKDKVKKLNIVDKVEFVGSLFGNKKIQFLCEADIFLFPTFHEEGLPYSILESLAAGTMVITTKIGGNIDVIRDGIEGFFVEPNNPEMLASKISNCCNDKELIKSMSINCRIRANENYGINRMVEQFREVYNYVAS